VGVDVRLHGHFTRSTHRSSVWEALRVAIQNTKAA
jgi:hypothetical protein